VQEAVIVTGKSSDAGVFVIIGFGCDCGCDFKRDDVFDGGGGGDDMGSPLVVDDVFVMVTNVCFFGKDIHALTDMLVDEHLGVDNA